MLQAVAFLRRESLPFLFYRLNMLPGVQLSKEESTMDVRELRKLPMTKLRAVAKQETDLNNVVALEKEELIKAIATVKGLAYDENHKDLNAIHAVKQDIRQAQKATAELLASGGDRTKIKKLRRKVKLLKRVTRHLARDAKLAAAQPAAPAASASTAPAV
jgi:hypothetical protein